VVAAFLLCRYDKYFKYRIARYLNSSSEFSYLNINYLAKQKLRITNTSRMKDRNTE